MDHYEALVGISLYIVFRKKHPLTFSSISPWKMFRFIQKKFGNGEEKLHIQSTEHVRLPTSTKLMVLHSAKKINHRHSSQRIIARRIG